MKREAHPAARAAEIDQQLAGFTRGRGHHGHGPEEHERSMQEWEAFRQAHIPGLKFSDRPRHLLLRAVREGSVVLFCPSLDGMELDEQRWEEIEPFLRKCGSGWHEMEVAQIPDGWSYRNIVFTQDHSIHDEPNPRLYDLDGSRKWQPWNDQFAGIWSEYLCRTMEARLALQYDSSARNEREAMVRARLQHHWEHGGNPSAFLEHVEVMVERWHVAPPLVTFGGNWNRQVKPVVNANLLVRYMREWLDNARKVPTSANATTLAKSKRPDLKLVALVHALRWLATKDREADISKDNAQALAEAAGSKGKLAGKELFDRYTLYTLKANSKAERMQDGQPHTVKKRYLVVIAMLEDHPKAKDMAERELEELHAEKVDAGK